MNPPYGERIAPKGQGSGGPPRPHRPGRENFEDVESPGPDGGQDPADAFYAGLAAHWKRHYTGWSAWILSPDPQLPSRLRLKESRRVPMWNGPIECRLMRFELVAGSARR
jgi:putative N6-adenine-specific DNA methylase